MSTRVFLLSFPSQIQRIWLGKESKKTRVDFNLLRTAIISPRPILIKSLLISARSANLSGMLIRQLINDKHVIYHGLFLYFLYLHFLDQTSLFVFSFVIKPKSIDQMLKPNRFSLHKFVIIHCFQ